MIPKETFLLILDCLSFQQIQNYRLVAVESESLSIFGIECFPVASLKSFLFRFQTILLRMTRRQKQINSMNGKQNPSRQPFGSNIDQKQTNQKLH